MKALLSFCFLRLFTFNASAETAFERVEKTRTLRCGYLVLPPEFSKDAKTGKFSGISYDVTNEIAKRLGLKVEWVEEVSFATMGASLKAKRFDALCFSLYRYTPQAMVMDYTLPLFATPTYVFVRADDRRFDKDINSANNSGVTLATIDGEMSQMIGQKTFPKAKLYSLPQMAGLTNFCHDAFG